MERFEDAICLGSMALGFRDWGLGFRWFPKIRGTFLGVPIIRIVICWVLYWGPLILGN